MSLPRVAWQAAVAGLILLGGFAALRCYGSRSYDRGREESQIAHTDSVRRAVTAALDSAEKVMVPVLERLVQQNDSLVAESREARRLAAQSVARARRAEEALRAIPDTLLAVTPPEVRALIDSLVVRSAALRADVDRLYVANVKLESQNDSLLTAAASWRSLAQQTRAALDTSAKEIAQLQALKTPKKRFGFWAGVGTGALTVAVLVTTILGVSR